MHLCVVLFIGGVVAATVELISLDPAISVPVHSYGTVSRWIVMYPTQTIPLVDNAKPRHLIPGGCCGAL